MTATAVGGRRPTGMHSCGKQNLLEFRSIHSHGASATASKNYFIIRGFHKHTELAILAFLPTLSLYSHIFAVSLFICTIWC